MLHPTPKWLDLFNTAFGAKGLVALAWWAGAYHAERIRNLQGTYPILRINGEAGAGKHTLVSNLWRLSGVADPEEISTSNHTFSALLAQLAKAINEPVVIDDEPSGDADESFNWEALRECYSTSLGMRADFGQPVRFRGALVIVGTGPNILKHRSVEVKLKHFGHAPERSAAVQALYELHISELSEFLTKVREHQDMAVFCMGKAEAMAFELADQVKVDLTLRDARNHAQLIALLDFIDTLFHVPAEALEAAKAVVRDMAWHTVSRTHVPIED